jgi:hypothetical protein
MHFLLTVGFLGAFGAFFLLGKTRYKSGEGPFERLPAGVPLAPEGRRVEPASDGTKYVVHYWKPGADGRQFHVAEVKGRPSWISFWFVPATGKRTLYLSLATAGELNDLRRDWAV